MNANLVSSLVTSVFLLFVITGFIFGWFRGLNKSLTRFIIVLVVGVLSFFVVPPLTKSILEMDISKLNIILGDVQVVTVQDFVTDILRQIPIIEDIIEASPTFEKVIELAPQIIINVLFFIIFFFILKWISMIIYWIIAGIFFSKKKMAGKDKHNFIGAILGAVQGLIVVFVLFVPFYGVVETVKPVSAALKQEQVVTSGAVTVAPENEDENSATKQLTESAKNIDAYITNFDSVWFNKVMGFIGVKKLGVSMFNELTTVKTGSLEISFMEEVECLANAYPHIRVLIEDGFDVKNNEHIDSLKTGFDKLYESKLLSNMVKEVVPEMADKWYNGYTFCEISKPELEDEATQELFDLLLFNLSIAEGDSVKTDLDTTFDIIMVANDASIIKTMVDGGNILDVLNLPENEDFISRIITKAVESKTMKALLPKVIYFGLDMVYDALDIDKSKIDQAEIESDDVIWDTEKIRLQNIFNNVIDIYIQVQDGVDVGEEALENLDFKLLGETFDNIRFSQLLGPSSIHIMDALLNSNEIVGSNKDTLAPFITKLKEAWAGTEPLAPTFESLGKALKLAKDLQTNVEDFDVKDLGDILTDFATNEALKDVVNEVINSDTLQDLGLDKETADIVDETISSIINADYSGDASLEKEIEAVKEVYDVANKVINAEEGVKVDVSLEQSESLIGALAESTILLDTVSNAESSLGEINIKENLTEEAQENIKTQIDSLDSEILEGKSSEEIEEIKNKLNSIFGF